MDFVDIEKCAGQVSTILPYKLSFVSVTLSGSCCVDSGVQTDTASIKKHSMKARVMHLC